MIGLYLFQVKTMSKNDLLDIEALNFCLGILFAITLVCIARKQSKRAEEIANREVRRTGSSSVASYTLLRFTLLVIAALAIASPANFTYTNYTGCGCPS